ncbi:MAG: polynucleotide kinase-phosphatase [Bacteroidota bacterium]
MKIEIPELALVVLVGPSGSGKSTFAKKYFLPTEVVSSDYCRAVVSDDENTLNANEDTFDLAHYIIGKRLKRGNLTVMDATNVQPKARVPLSKLAKDYHVLKVAIVLNMPLETCLERNERRPDRTLKNHVVRRQHHQMKQAARRLKKEGFKKIYVLNSPEELANVEIVRQKLWNDKKEMGGPFDIIGDVHGCFLELKELLVELGYKITKHRDRTRNYGYTVKAPAGRTAVFVGDLTDRGPASSEVLRLVMSMVKNETALCVCGNHDSKLWKKLSGRNVKLKHGLAETMEQLATEPAEFVEEAKDFLGKLISHYVLDAGKLVIAHAGLREEMHGRASGAVRSFCMYGETTGEIDEFGLPVRYNWAKEYDGKATVVYGHTPVPTAEWLNNTMDIDTGCVFGGALTALRYPERTLVEMKAKKNYCEPVRPMVSLIENGLSAQQANNDLLDISDVLGKRFISTRLNVNVMIREEQAIAALEVMSRFAINPKWLAYLPPTMSPSETSELPNFLEHPKEAFAYFRKNGVQHVICEEKHMGSRAVVVIGQNGATIEKTFGIANEGIGKVYTRTGRAFFEDGQLEAAFLSRLNKALTVSNFWRNHRTQWAIFDCELMPWSAKAQSLLENQYAAVGASAMAALPEVAAALQAVENRGLSTKGLLKVFEEKTALAGRFTEAYRQYCWPVSTLDDYKLAPFHLLATEGQTYFDKDHLWHIETIHNVCQADPDFLLATPYKVVDVNNEMEVQAATDWWLELTQKGGEGMVVKPLNFIERRNGKVLQPAIKCRGQEYLRIIYGADYTMPYNLEALKKRGLHRKRSMAIKEFALGVESLERFVAKQPLRKVHECVFGVLAMESEAVDPRL